jgi:hypothetical protein
VSLSFAVDQHQWKYNDYNLILEHNPEMGASASKLLIIKGDNKLFEVEGNIELYNGYKLEEINNNISSINSPLFVVNSYSGGAHCCHTTTILELGRQFQLLAKLDGGYSPVIIKTNTNINQFAIEVEDWSYAYRWTSFAKSYAPKVILRYEQGRYVPNFKAMKTIANKNTVVDSFIKHINSSKYKAFKYAEDQSKEQLSAEQILANEAYLGKLLTAMFDLIYSGNFIHAIYVLDQTWPGDLQSKQKFKYSILKAINESPYSQAIKQMNNLD